MSNSTSGSASLVKNTTVYAIGDIIPKLLSFLVFPVLTSYLTPEDYGIINYVNTLNVFWTIIGVLCLNTYYLVYYYRQPDEDAKRKLIGCLSLFTIVFNVIGMAFICLLGFLYPHLFSARIPFYPYIVIGVVTNFFSILMIFPAAFYRVRENPLPLTVLNVLRGILTTLCTVVLVVCYGFTSLGVLYSSMFITIVFGVIFIAVTWRQTKWNINRTLLYEALAFSVPLIPGSIASYLMSMSDRFFIERFLDLTQLGIYSTAASLAMILNVIAYGSYKAFEPYVFKIYGQKDFGYKFNKVRDYYFAVILWGGACLSILSQDFFRIFASERYQTVFYYVPLVEISVVLSSFTMLYSTVLAAQGKTKLSSLFTLIGGGVSVLLNLFLMPYIGLLAACVASILSFGIMLLLSVVYARVYGHIMRIVFVIVNVEAVVVLSVYGLHIENVWLSVAIRSVLLIVLATFIFRVTRIKISDVVRSFRK